ncbi:MAG: S24 family peptidase [Candidatus Peregrinibacteria bacterium]
MRPLHRFQARLLEVLKNISEDEGYSLEQLRKAIGASSKSQVVHHMKQLEERGLVKRDPDNPAHFTVFGEDESEDSFTFLPLLALAACGEGIDNEQHVIERLPVRSSFIPAKLKNAFLVRAESDSMEPRIHAGDVVLVEPYIDGRHNLEGKVIVCDENNETKIKRYTTSGKRILLESENARYKSHVVEDPDSLKIHGIVRCILFSKI